ncbi:type II toxin-antitoxin system death-on-curing family toxin [Halanaerobacter jeridensis]|uniref:Death-on-curing protein n=1 Tax=Halanaerobacter jeridensis TaxID=706427 RepID=A0A938XR22_9FIRM|nr:type II toxin-antitoxin system death-on-curing family toxin [Halanaerobacter jeridensis]MBM7557997.1 death-on-curing protein [Halanaerobacter jeridensis]
MPEQKIKFIKPISVIVLHQAILDDYGGTNGIRDINLLESAVAQAKNVYHYGNADLFEIAANYAYHLCNNHPFHDGNKRTAYYSMKNFLGINGYEIKGKLKERKKLMIKIENDEFSKKDLAKWLQENTQKI